jgi:hypothetical protein
MRILLQQPDIITDTKFACTAAQVCSGWRQAVVDSPGHSKAVSLKDSSWPQLQSLYHWLQRHSRLVNTLAVTFRGRPRGASQTVLQQQQQQQQQSSSHGQGVQGRLLASDHSEYTQGGLQILGLLAGKGLVELDMAFAGSVGISGAGGNALMGSALASKLARLQGLQRLTIHGADAAVLVPGSCLAGLAQLTRLTSLKISGEWSNVMPALQPLLEQPLPLQQLHIFPGTPPPSSRDGNGRILGIVGLPALNMAGLTNLLEFSTRYHLPAQLVLPSQLQRLSTAMHLAERASTWTVAHLLQLPQLHHLDLRLTGTDPSMVLPLAHLPTLQHLRLRYNSFAKACATALAWPGLPQLRELDLDLRHDSLQQDTMGRMAAVLANVAATASLTNFPLKLQLSLWSAYGTGVELCNRLAGLSQLQDLSFKCRFGLKVGDALALGDAQALTALTGLTRLVLCGDEDKV